MLKELENLKKKAREDYEHKIKKLELEYQKNLDAIERVFALMDQNDSDANIDTKETAEVQKKIMATSQTVREIISRFNSEYSVRDIRREAANMNPPREVSKNVLHSVIKQKRKNNEIKTVEEGSGRSPAIYRNVNKKEDSAPHMAEAESLFGTGELGEGIKPANL